MSKLKVWINAARLRTLPLSISGILVGSAMAKYYGSFDWAIFFLAILTTVGFQITSNFANDYGDGVKGTDNEDRIGPKRVLQSGLLSKKSLKQGIFVSIIIDFLFVFALLYFSFEREDVFWIVLFLILGGFSIWAAIRYTIGENAYGYLGLGDFFVFVFFGLLGVVGSMFLYIKTIPLYSFLPAIAIGLLSVGVLNLNNLRDCYSDQKVGKNTLVVKIGFDKGKIYHFIILSLAFISLFFYVLHTAQIWLHYISLLAFIPIVFHLLRVKKNKTPRLLDPELKKLALNTFLMAILFYFSYYNFL